MMDYPELVQRCEEWIRKGRLSECAAELKKLNTAQVPEKFRFALASFARRTGLPRLGLRLLTPLVLDERHEPTLAQLAEYGVLLQRCGANADALRVLTAIDPAKVPEVSLYRAFCHFNRWDYELALPHLHAYLDADLAPYARLVGRVNLADALIFTERLTQATELLHALKDEARAAGHIRLLGNCHEMLGQIHLLRDEPDRAERELREAGNIFGGTKALDQLYVSRWTTIAESMRTKDESALLRFRGQALERRDWESVRQVDFFRLKLSFQRPLFEHLYFGTPYAPYRAKLRRHFGLVPAGDALLWGDPGAERRFDVATARLDGADTAIAGRRAHAVIALLARDLYRPVRAGEIFGELWPGEHFDIFSSPNRVHQAVSRARRFLDDEKLALRLHSDAHGYHLIRGEGVALSLPLEAAPVTAYGRYLRDLRLVNAESGFDAAGACRQLGISRSAFRRFSVWALENGRLERLGASTKTLYYFPLRAAA